MPLAFERTRLVIPDNVMTRVVDGTTVVVDIDTGRSFTLDEIGTRVWTLLTSMPSVQAAYDALLAEFVADNPDQVRGDLEAMIDTLTGHQLLVAENLPQSPVR